MNSASMPNGTRYVNHFNPVDWAFKGVFGWETNQLLKPDLGYVYAAPAFQVNDPVLANWRDLVFPGDRFEIFAFAAESHSEATATVANVGGVFSFQRNLMVAPYTFGDKHKGHSAQYRSTIQKRWNYWSAVLVDFDIK